jgi:hypothetical protein
VGSRRGDIGNRDDKRIRDWKKGTTPLAVSPVINGEKGGIPLVFQSSFILIK